MLAKQNESKSILDSDVLVEALRNPKLARKILNLINKNQSRMIPKNTTSNTRIEDFV